MMNLLKSLAANFATAGEIFSFLWQRRMFWMAPMVVVLLAFGLVLMFATATGIGPFIYTLF